MRTQDHTPPEVRAYLNKKIDETGTVMSGLPTFKTTAEVDDFFKELERLFDNTEGAEADVKESGS
jgi:hypothetical protein